MTANTHMTPSQIKRMADTIIGALPDDPLDAITVLALTYANVICSTHLPLDQGIEALRRAHRQMQAGGVGRDG